MKPDTKFRGPQNNEADGNQATQDVADSRTTPRSVAENVVLTIKILAGFVLVGAGLWGLDALVAAR